MSLTSKSLSIACTLFLSLSLSAQSLTCHQALNESRESILTFPPGSHLARYENADRLTVHTEVELDISVARTVSILSPEAMKRIISLRDSEEVGRQYIREIESFSQKIFSQKHPFHWTLVKGPREVLSAMESAFRADGMDVTGASIAAITFYHVLKNPGAAQESLNNFIWRMRPEIRDIGQFTERMSHIEYNIQLTGVVATLIGIGTGYFYAGTGGGLPNLIHFAALAFATGHGSHFVLKHIPYQAITAPFRALHQRLLRRSLQRSLKQYVLEETDSERAELFSYRFEKWREKIAQNRGSELTILSASRNVAETAFLLSYDFPLLTLPFKLDNADFKKLKAKEYQVLVSKFSDIMDLRRTYLQEIIAVLREAESVYGIGNLGVAERGLSEVERQELVANIQYFNLNGVQGLIAGTLAAEAGLQQTLQTMVSGSQALQMLIDNLQIADQRIENLMLQK